MKVCSHGVFPLLGAALILWGCAKEQPSSDISQSPEVADPEPATEEEVMLAVYEPWENLFNKVFVEDDIYFAGIPTEEGLRLAAERGVTLVINLLPDEQQATRVLFDESALLEGMGVAYERIPMVPSSFSVADVDRLAELVADRSGPCMIHCASSNRVGGLWATYLHRQENVPLEEAIRRGKTVGLRSDSMIEAVHRVAAED